MAQYPPPIILSPDRSTVGQDPGYSPGRTGSALLRDQIPIKVNRVVAPDRLHLLPRTGPVDRIEKLSCRPGSC